MPRIASQCSDRHAPRTSTAGGGEVGGRRGPREDDDGLLHSVEVAAAAAAAPALPLPPPCFSDPIGPAHPPGQPGPPTSGQGPEHINRQQHTELQTGSGANNVRASPLMMMVSGILCSWKAPYDSQPAPDEDARQD